MIRASWIASLEPLDIVIAAPTRTIAADNLSSSRVVKGSLLSSFAKISTRFSVIGTVSKFVTCSS